MSCPIIFNSNTIKLTVHTSCYLGLRLTVLLCIIKFNIPITGHLTISLLTKIQAKD